MNSRYSTYFAQSLARRLLAALATTLSFGVTAQTAQTAQTTPLAAVKVELREVDLTFPAEAVVEAIKQATIAAQVAGRVIEARVDAGTHVKAGEVLMRIDAREAAQSLAGAQAQHANARANLERVKNLHAQKFVSQAALDKAEADYKSAAANAGQASATSSHATIVAPFAGVVAQRLAEEGEMAAPGKPLISIFDPQGLRVVASIPQYKLAELQRAPRARIEIAGTGKWLDATRVEVLPTADAVTHDVRVRLYLPEIADAGAGIIPGVFARAHFVIGTAKKLLVPAAAVLRRGELTGVYVIDERGLPRLRQVRLGEIYPGASGGDIEVLAGIAAGEKIALDPLKAGFQATQRK